MVRKLLYMLLCLSVISCRPQLPDLQTRIIVGVADTSVMHQRVFDPALEMSAVRNETARLRIDMNQDEQDDLEIRYQYTYTAPDLGQDEWDVTVTSALYVEMLDPDFRIAARETRDSVYYCLDETGPAYQDVEYTLNTGFVCSNSEATTGVSRVIDGFYARYFEPEEIVSSGLNWQGGEVDLARHEYARSGDLTGGVSHDNQTDLLLGMSTWNEDTYLGLCKVDTPRNKYGYIRFKLVEVDDHTWRLELKETVMSK